MKEPLCVEIRENEGGGRVDPPLCVEIGVRWRGGGRAYSWRRIRETKVEGLCLLLVTKLGSTGGGGVIPLPGVEFGMNRHGGRVVPPPGSKSGCEKVEEGRPALCRE